MRALIEYKNPPYFLSEAGVGGLEERRGRFGSAFDFSDPSDRFGEGTWESAEGAMARFCLHFALKKGKIPPSSVSVLYSGDLQNQCTATALGMYDLSIPSLGLYGACSTCSEGLLCLGTYLQSVKEGAVGAVVTSSHNSAAERQFRTPLEYGSQRTPTASFTSTAAGAFLLGTPPLSEVFRASRATHRVRLRRALVGKVVDGAIGDPSDMGSAMAPAAADTVLTFLSLSGTVPEDYDAIVTGDLGRYGSQLLVKLCMAEGVDISRVHRDCGVLMYDEKRQDCHAGASGCGCSASLLAVHFLPLLRMGRIRRILFLSTGALMSPTSVKQKKHIFGVAPAVEIVAEDGAEDGVKGASGDHENKGENL